MKKYKTIHEFLAELDEDKLAQVNAIRKLIIECEPKLTEHIKWNAPSYVLDNEDRITFNLMNKQGLVKVVLHMGATRKESKKGAPIMDDETGLIEWSSDIRGMITFEQGEDISQKQKELTQIFKNWLKIK